MTEQVASKSKKSKWSRRLWIALAIYLVHYFLFGYHFITGRVVDEETGKPIEGAIVLGVWMWGFDIAFSTKVLYTTQEAITDDKGRFFIRGVLNPLINQWMLPFVEEAELTVYKRGYVAWNNLSTWKDGPRKDFRWKNGLVVKMEKWKEWYSFNDHESFISNATVGALTQRFADAMDWERLEQVKENDLIDERRRNERIVK